MSDVIPAPPAVPMETPSERKFALAQRQAKALASSELVPAAYKGNPANCLIALELAERTQSSPFMVMQNVHIIQGRPSWSSQFIIAAINGCGRFAPLQFRMAGEGDKRSCVAFAKVLDSGDVVEGPEVSMAMAREEGWSTKNGSKWKTLPELMLRYRAATFFGRLYAPEILMGMQSADEIADVHGFATARDVTPANAANAALGLEPADEAVDIEIDPATGEVVPPPSGVDDE